MNSSRCEPTLLYEMVPHFAEGWFATPSWGWMFLVEMIRDIIYLYSHIHSFIHHVYVCIYIFIDR